MTRPFQIATLTALALLLVACASTGPTVSSIAEPDFAPRAGATYAWQPVQRTRPEEIDPRVDNDIVRGRIERGLHRAFDAKGWRSADAAGADYLLSFRVGVRDRSETRTELRDPNPFPDTRIVCGRRGCMPISVWGWYGPPVATTRTIEYVEGGVMIDLVERATGRLVWRSTIADRLVRPRMPSQEETDAAMARAVADLPMVGQAP
ncbi:MAG: DUF4136 domain-containing protein [Pseudomonadota bacterium]|jgi:hypothetical protein